MEIIIISAIWCPSCLVMKKIYKELENIFKDISFFKYDYDFDCDIVKSYNISNILPVLIIKKDSNELKRITGEHQLEEFVKEIKECLNED